MGYISLVDHTAEEVDEYSYRSNDSKDGSWAQPFFRWRGPATRYRRKDLEEVSTFIWINACI
jgi:hypothetical protein